MAARRYPGDSLERLQAEMTRILSVFDGVCSELGLTYFVDSGTVLGAVRHGGFIPWDDDVDVAMPVDDYRRFLREAPAVLPRDLSLHTWDNTENYPMLWAKLWKDDTLFVDRPCREAGLRQGIFIDVFPYVPLDADPAAARRQRRRMLAWQRVSYLKYIAHPNNVPNGAARAACAVAHQVARFVPKGLIGRRFEDAWACKTPGDTWINPCYAQGAPMPGEYLLPPRPMEFDGLTVMGPHDPVAYLERKYGDWQALPPEDQRFTHAPEELDFGA
ncbi:LicD family protein [Caniella muris]|uniref:LicD family protein n=1 Tax=Caniella muris TaxID=2941502 RepID=UPI00203B794C|nr:LicD family protein [Caniella muris]